MIKLEILQDVCRQVFDDYEVVLLTEDERELQIALVKKKLARTKFIIAMRENCIFNVNCLDAVELSMPSTLRDLAKFIEKVEDILR